MNKKKVFIVRYKVYNQKMVFRHVYRIIPPVSVKFTLKAIL